MAPGAATTAASQRAAGGAIFRAARREESDRARTDRDRAERRSASKARLTLAVQQHRAVAHLAGREAIARLVRLLEGVGLDGGLHLAGREHVEDLDEVAPLTLRVGDRVGVSSLGETHQGRAQVGLETT